MVQIHCKQGLIAALYSFENVCTVASTYPQVMHSKILEIADTETMAPPHVKIRMPT